MKGQHGCAWKFQSHEGTALCSNTAHLHTYCDIVNEKTYCLTYFAPPCNEPRARLSQDPEVWAHTFVPPSAETRRTVVSYWRKYLHEVPVNHLGGLSLPRRSVVRFTDRPDMNIYSIPQQYWEYFYKWKFSNRDWQIRHKLNYFVSLVNKILLCTLWHSGVTHNCDLQLLLPLGLYRSAIFLSYFKIMYPHQIKS